MGSSLKSDWSIFGYQSAQCFKSTSRVASNRSTADAGWCALPERSIVGNEQENLRAFAHGL